MIPIFDINNASRSVASIAEKRKEDLITKYNNCRNNIEHDREYITDQRIIIDALRVHKMYHVQNANESNMIALTSHDAAVSK